jgi:hypothetical protein
MAEPDPPRRKMITERQYRRLMSAYEKTGNIVGSALRADVHPQTARKYIQAAKPPSELQAPRTWRTRPDPLEKVWPEAKRMLETPRNWRLGRSSITSWPARERPGGMPPAHLLPAGAALAGHGGTGEGGVLRAGPQTGRADAVGLDACPGVGGDDPGGLLDHLLCHCVLPYSNWEWATRCVSESFLSLVGGLQAALIRLGRCPAVLGTDNSSAATHELEAIPGRGPWLQLGLPGAVHAFRPDADDDPRADVPTSRAMWSPSTGT